MDSLSSLAPTSLSSTSFNFSSSTVKYNGDSLILQNLSLSGEVDTVGVGIDDLSKSLSIKAQKIIDKLNEILKAKLPDGVQSLKPEEVTPEATADKIVNGATAFFDVFSKQNPDLQGEELLNKFMETIRSGISQGYDDAVNTLQDLGAFDFEGVKDGIEKTKGLIDDKLKVFETEMRKKLGLDEIKNNVSNNTSTNLLELAGQRVSLDLAA